MDAYAKATEALTDFFRDDTQGVFAFKGPWGVGKSHFVREDYLNRQRQVIPQYVAYVSLFGLRTIQEVREAINYSLNNKDGSPVIVSGKKFATSVKPKASAKGVVLDLADITARTFWYLAQRNGTLIVFDDLERAHKELALEQVLGLASNLTENTKVKVLLILNEKRLSDQGIDDVLLKYREKIIDVEHTFRPEPRQLVSRYLAESKLVEAVLTCLEADEGTNIRLIFKINRALAYFRQVAGARGISCTNEDLAQMAKIVWLHYVSPIPLTQTLLNDAWRENFWGKSVSADVSEKERKLYRLAGEAKLSLGRFNELVLEYLSDGYFSEASIQAALRDQTSQAEKAEIDRRIYEALSLYAHNFRATENEVIEPVKRLLDDYAEKLNKDQMLGYTKFLEQFDVSTTAWWRQHVEATLPKLSIPEMQDYLTFVTDEEAKTAIRARLPKTRIPDDPWAAFLVMAREKRWYKEQMNALAEKPVEFFVDNLKNEVGDFLEDVRTALNFLGMGTNPLSGKTIHQKLVAALQQIAKESRLRSLQVGGLLAHFALEPTAIKTNS